VNLVTAKVFMSGNSQAIRLPKEFRIEGNEVYIKKEKKGILLLEKPKKTWGQIIEEMPAFPDFDVNRKAIGGKPREVKL
jgi:antitoxin VapB